MSDTGPRQLSRRGLLAAGGAAGLGTLPAACGSDRDGRPRGGASGGTGGAWSFRDDRGTGVSLHGRPGRVVAYVGLAAALHDFGGDHAIVGVFGPGKRKNGAPDPLAGGFDVGKATVVGSAYNQFNIEKYAALRPELLVTHTYGKGALWYVPDDSKEKITKLAPAAALRVSGARLPHVIGRHAELAEKLGADLHARRVTEARARFEAARDDIRRAARARRGVTVLACSASADKLYVSDPAPYADLAWFRDLGVEFVVPKGVRGGFFESLSWERADRYRADVMLVDSRSTALQPGELAGRPTWSRLPAVRAGQLVPWPSEPRYSWAGTAPTLRAVAKALASAKKVT